MKFFSKISQWKFWPVKFFKTQSSIYKQVVYVITLLSVFLFLAFGILFRSVNEQYLQKVIHQTGNNIARLVEGSLYYSMLENDNASLQNTLEIIREMPGIDDVSMYDYRDSLVYSYEDDMRENKLFNPNCASCHDVSSLFPEKTKGYKILHSQSGCAMNPEDCDHRHLLIRSPILNEPSCYTNACHMHPKEDEVLGSLLINIPLEELDSSLQESSTDFFILATLMTLLLLSFLVFFTRKKIHKPLSAIIHASESVANGDMSKRLEVIPNQLDDMRMVSSAFNNMLDKINKVNLELQNWSHQLEYKVQKKTDELNEAYNELIKSERMASLGRLSSSVAHELNNPLAGVITYAKLIHKNISKPEITKEKKEQMLKYLNVIVNETKRCGEIVQGLLDFSRQDQRGFEEKSLHHILHETCELMRNKMKMSEITCIHDFCATQDVIQCIPNQIKQALMAILVNASEAVDEKGEIVIKTENFTEEQVLLKITDNGIGIAEEDLPHIFEPFFSAKNKTSGIGLGLAIVHGIIQNHNGKIEVRSKRGDGATFLIYFPLANKKQ